MKPLLTIFYSLLALCATAQDNVRLVINPHGHTALISGTALTPDEKLLVSVSHDKSLKIWSTEYGNLVDEIYGERGDGNKGQLYCVAISPDGKYLVTGGYLIEQNDNNVTSLIRVYDFAKRKMIKLLRGHSNVIHSLTFSPNGKYLASAGADGHVLVWNVNDFSLYHDFAGHTKTARTVAFMSDDELVSGGWDNKLNVYNLPKKKIEKTVTKNYPVNEIVYNTELKKLMVACNEYSKVMVMNNDLEIKQEVDAFKPIGAVATKGNKLIIGQERLPYMTSMYQYIDGEFKISNGFAGMNNTVTCAGILKKGLAYSAGGRDNEIVFWSYTEAAKDGSVNFSQDGVRLSGYGIGVCAVGFGSNMVAFTQGTCDYAFGDGTLKTLFDLQTGGLYKLPAASEKEFRGITKEQGSAKLKHEAGGILNYPDACLGYYENGEKIWTLTFGEESGYGTNSYSFAGNNWVVSGGNPDIYIFNKGEARQTAVLKGHEGEIRGLWSDKEGKYIISGGTDQTIRIWNISNISHEKQYMKYEELYASSIKFFKEKYPDLDFSKPGGMEKLYNRVLNDFGDDTARYLVVPTVVEPDVSIFIGWNNEWVMWTNDGYFKGSKEGSKYIGYHINMGNDKDAKYYPFDQFDLKYNRPDIINQRLGIGDSLYNESLKKAYERRLKKMGLKEEDLTGDKNLPMVEIVSTAENTHETVYKLEITATTEKNDLFKINIYNNGVPLFGTKGYAVEEKEKRGLKKTFDVPLVTGENKIQVSVVDKTGAESMRESITVLCTNQEKKGNLYLVTIGVSEYAASAYNLKYPSKDAGDIEKLFTGATIYDHVFTKSFTNEQVNKAMLGQIKSFLEKAGAGDQVIIFIAGHGVLNSQYEYYFASHNMDFEAPEKNGISYAEIEALLDDIKSLKKILFMDTCHSGEVDKDDIEADNQAVASTGEISFRNVGTAVKHKSLGMAQTTELMKEVFNDMRKGTGSNVVSSASGYELARESDEWHNGLFTYVLLNGIKSMEADLNKDGMIMISELKSYSGQKVAEMSNGRQVPANRNENISFDYRVW